MRVLGTLCLGFLSLLLAEGTLQVLARSSRTVGSLLAPVETATHSVPDALLVHRGNPAWPDHDARGFRNTDAVTHANLVLLGDSQTYGTGVERLAAWPSILGSRSGLTVYNMAFGGWGPGQGLLLLPEALALEPSRIIYAFYFGNDLPDVFTLALRLPEVERFLPRDLIDSSRQLERRDPLGERVAFLFAQAITVQTDKESGARAFLSRYSKLYGLARGLRRSVRGSQERMPVALLPNMDDALRRMTPKQRQFVSEFRSAEWRTLLTPQYRGFALDDSDPRIKAAVVGAKQMLVAMDSICRSRQVAFSVLLIPTKERVFATRFKDAASNPAVAQVVASEARIQKEIVSWLQQHGVQYIDALASLSNSSRQPYFENADGHPNEVGHEIIADLIRRHLTREGAERAP